MNIKLDKSKRYLLACSYGPDSMALFSILYLNHYSFAVAHVNYHLREESNYEMNSLKDYCNARNIPFYCYDEFIEFDKGNIESICREVRFNFFKNITSAHHFDSVLLAHHLDDLLETYLLQKKRNNLVIYYGLNEVTTIKGMTIIRPLLSYEKNELINYCKINEMPYSIDKTNLENTYSRNKIRHEIIEKMNKKEKEILLAEINDKNKQLKDMFDNLSTLDLGDIKILLSLDKISYLYALNKLVKDNKINKSISKRLGLELKKILLSKKSNVLFKIDEDFYFIKEYRRIYFLTSIEEIPYSYQLCKPDILDTPYFYLDFTGDTSSRNVKVDDYPITIRSGRNDDKIKINDYDVTLRRLFIDWKLPFMLRKRWPIIENKNGEIIYVPKYSKDFIIDKTLNFYVKVK